jgi:hypothetical protein
VPDDSEGLALLVSPYLLFARSGGGDSNPDGRIGPHRLDGSVQPPSAPGGGTVRGDDWVQLA